MKLDVVKIASIAGTVLGIAGTLVSSWAGQKGRDEEIAKRVAETLAEQSKNQ